METSSLAPSEPVAATIDELDIASTGYTPRFQSKKLEINEPAPTIDQPPENEWVRYFVLIAFGQEGTFLSAEIRVWIGIRFFGIPDRN